MREDSLTPTDSEATADSPAKESVTASSARTPKLNKSLLIPVLFTTTAFFGAALLFVVQPLVAKILLPSYGGAATVWATSSLFFQTVLLGGYLLVHGTARLGPRRQSLIYLPFILLAVTALPLALPANATAEEANPILWLLRTLFLMIGLPFAVLTTTGPLIQKWYSWSNAPRSQDPYFLYAASNGGSFVGLLAYPFAVEPFMSLAAQRLAWTLGFVIFLALLTACAATIYKANTWTPKLKASADEKTSAEKIPARRQIRWIVLAFLPSSLMLGVTTHISTDVAAIPLLWVIPLAIYLATMIGAFASTSRRVSPVVTYAAVIFSVIGLGASVAGPTLSVIVAAVTAFSMLAFVAYAAHAHLAADRPSTEHLTYFYVLVSLGGALGGLLNGMLAPLVLSQPVEFPLVLCLVPLLLLATDRHRLLGGIVLSMVMTVMTVYVINGQDENRLTSVRTFYGSYAVKPYGEKNVLVHGTTIHGEQFRAKALSQEPTSYYAKSGPLGQVFEKRQFEAVTAVGLGIGTVAAYGKPGDAYTFIEIDPAVTKLAENKDYFTYLSATKADVNILTGDGRLKMAEIEDGSQDLLILDAFSSDSIPVHLLTEEALKEFSKKLTPDGVLMVHISNRVFDLAPVVAGNAQALNMRAVIGEGDADKLAADAAWVAVTKDNALANDLARGEDWTDISKLKPVRWTDDYSSVLDVLRGF